MSAFNILWIIKFTNLNISQHNLPSSVDLQEYANICTYFIFIELLMRFL